MNYLGLDYGSKNIGLAKATSDLKIATPFKILKNSSDLYADLQKVMNEEKTDKLVVGYPLTLKGEAGKQAKEVEVFIKKLATLGLAVELQDERFSSRSAVGNRREDDASAAALILQTYLERL